MLEQFGLVVVAAQTVGCLMVVERGGLGLDYIAKLLGGCVSKQGWNGWGELWTVGHLMAQEQSEVAAVVQEL